MQFTSINEKHRHRWNKKRVFTSKNAGHRHRIDLRRMIALEARPNGHTHRLLK